MTENQETKPTKKISIIVDNDKNTSLHYSAASGKEEDVLRDLEIEPKVDAENYLGWTPLMMACKNGHMKVVELLLKHRADASKKNKFGMSVFLVSIASGNLELVHFILQHLLCGGVSRQSMQYLFSPLSVSVLFCHQHILQYLTEQNFNLNTVTLVTGITPLMFASAMENSEAFKLLLSRGADATIKNYLGFTAHDITQFKTRKINVKLPEYNQTQSPMFIMKSPHLLPQQHQIPYTIIPSPQPSFIVMSANDLNHHLRKSSNTLSPSPNYYLTASNITPIPPMHYLAPPQMFFPPEFSPTQLPAQFFAASPGLPNTYNNSNDLLNSRINQSNMFLSPIAQANFNSPCV